eukprot:4090683-Amphidinium_carterae.1
MSTLVSSVSLEFSKCQWGFASEAPVPKKKEEEAPPPDNRTPEQKEADEFKAKGNELYKQKKFEE